jgi:hypothetical protein
LHGDFRTFAYSTIAWFIGACFSKVIYMATPSSYFALLAFSEAIKAKTAYRNTNRQAKRQCDRNEGN